MTVVARMNFAGSRPVASSSVADEAAGSALPPAELPPPSSAAFAAASFSFSFFFLLVSFLRKLMRKLQVMKIKDFIGTFLTAAFKKVAG